MNISKKIIFYCLVSLIHFSYSKYYSQYGQDKFVYENYFKGKNGFFVDIGAYDGVYFSNTCFLEELGWKGICVEPQPEVFKELCKNRSALCINACITDEPGIIEFTQIICPSSPVVQMLSGVTQNYDPRHATRIESESGHFNGTKQIIQVQGYPLTHIMDYYGWRHIDYLSIDIEGGELKILQSIPFDRIRVNIIGVENNYGDPIKAYLESKGFKYVTRLGADEFYINKQFEKELNHQKHGKRS